MIEYQMTSDATLIYRDSASAPTFKANTTSDVGNVASFIRDSAIRVAPPARVSDVWSEEIPAVTIVR